MNETVERWRQQALHDFDSANKNYDIGCYDVCLVLCQQAAEKMLKALYIYQTSQEPPRTHSLRRLVELCDLPNDVLDYALDLDSYYLSLRYPDVSEDLPYELCDADDADHGLTQAHNLLTAVETILRE